MQRFRPDFIALVTYTPPEKGGREAPVCSGYQPVLKFDGSGYESPGENVLTDREVLSLGDTAEVSITMMAFEVFSNSLFVGQQFEIYEPPRLVGNGIIKKILNKDLERD
jgi:translation elongation factor EF-Tu-like GTPase